MAAALTEPDVCSRARQAAMGASISIGVRVHPSLNVVFVFFLFTSPYLAPLQILERASTRTMSTMSVVQT